ncbi:hypothetical protein VTP01DRAFT_3508 [Rhizomucor pusillus]|uniref:uncharacterized protein n=1 Tax=Rhizomucor pusillus TaxID=4840 RepID=UPI0037445A32
MEVNPLELVPVHTQTIWGAVRAALSKMKREGKQWCFDDGHEGQISGEKNQKLVGNVVNYVLAQDEAKLAGWTLAAIREKLSKKFRSDKHLRSQSTGVVAVRRIVARFSGRRQMRAENREQTYSSNAVYYDRKDGEKIPALLRTSYMSDDDESGSVLRPSWRSQRANNLLRELDEARAEQYERDGKARPKDCERWDDTRVVAADVALDRAKRDELAPWMMQEQ